MGRYLARQIDLRPAEILSALLAFVLAISTFTSPDSAPISVLLDHMLPEWAYANMICAVLCLVASFVNRENFTRAARFMSGCFWGTVVMLFANAQAWLPVFWMGVVLFAFDIYLVAVKGQSWSRSNSSIPGG